MARMTPPTESIGVIRAIRGYFLSQFIHTPVLRLSSDRLIQREHGALRVSEYSNGADIRHQGGRHDRRRSELSCLCSAGFAIGYMEVGYPMRGSAWGRIYVGRDSSDHVFCGRAIDDVTVTVFA